MYTFNIKLADIPMEINAIHDKTEKFCEEYLTDETPVLSVTIEQGDIDRMRLQDMKTAIAEGRAGVVYSDRYLETMALCKRVMDELVRRDVLLFHGSVVAVNGKAYMFTAKSGTGKTTHTRLWLKCFPECHVLNGDKPLLLFRDGRVYACGSPWRGKEGYGVNEILPLEAICFLERSETNEIDEVDFNGSFEHVLNQTHIPDGSIMSVINMINKLSAVKLYRLGCNMEDEAAQVSFGAMVKSPKCPFQGRHESGGAFTLS